MKCAMTSNVRGAMAVALALVGLAAPANAVPVGSIDQEEPPEGSPPFNSTTSPQGQAFRRWAFRSSAVFPGSIPGAVRIVTLAQAESLMTFAGCFLEDAWIAVTVSDGNRQSWAIGFGPSGRSFPPGTRPT